MKPLGLLAGNGRFPFLVAEEARKIGRRVVAIATLGALPRPAQGHRALAHATAP